MQGGMPLYNTITERKKEEKRKKEKKNNETHLHQ